LATQRSEAVEAEFHEPVPLAPGVDDAHGFVMRSEGSFEAVPCNDSSVLLGGAEDLPEGFETDQGNSCAAVGPMSGTGSG
jgi:hypothetical protein